MSCDLLFDMLRSYLQNIISQKEFTQVLNRYNLTMRSILQEPESYLKRPFSFLFYSTPMTFWVRNVLLALTILQCKKKKKALQIILNRPTGCKDFFYIVFMYMKSKMSVETNHKPVLGGKIQPFNKRDEYVVLHIPHVSCMYPPPIYNHTAWHKHALTSSRYPNPCQHVKSTLPTFLAF